MFRQHLRIMPRSTRIGHATAPSVRSPSMDLLDSLQPGARVADDAARRWARSGAMALTGTADGPPLGAPAGVVTLLDRLAVSLSERTGELGRRVVVDGTRLLGERAALTSLHRNGRTSCGGATRLLPAADGWVAVGLARDSDVDLLPAWLGVESTAEVAGAIAARTVAAVVERGALLGLAVAGLGEAQRPAMVVDAIEHPIAPRRQPRSVEQLVVVDLSSLWAGPLCGQLLADAGLRVVKVESTTRPDGARLGSPEFFDLLNGRKESVALPLATAAGRAALAKLVAAADVVIEASRPRALRQLGIDPAQLLDSGGPSVWVSITGHGSAPSVEHRVAFGDDAAVAGGLVAWADGEPVFVADAAADPATGLLAATAVVDRLVRGGRWHLHLALAHTAAAMARGPVMQPADPVAPPGARPVTCRAAPLGTHTEAVLAELC